MESSGLDPWRGLSAADAAAPAPVGVAAPGPSNLIPSCGFHDLSLGKLVPGEVCLADPGFGGVGGRGAAGLDFWGGGGGGLFGLPSLAYVLSDRNATASPDARVGRNAWDDTAGGLVARRAARGSIVCSSPHANKVDYFPFPIQIASAITEWWLRW